jgi:hypothetical protein
MAKQEQTLAQPPFSHEIFLEISKHASGDRATLSAMTQTSKVLHALTISELWKDMDTIVPILKLLPVDALLPGSNIILQRTLQKADWERFTHYSYHVKKLIFQGDSLPLEFYSPIWVESLLHCHTVGLPPCLLPRLHTLFFTATSNKSIHQLLQPLLSQNLRSLSLNFTSGDSVSDLQNLAECFESLPPPISKLELNFWLEQLPTENAHIRPSWSLVRIVRVCSETLETLGIDNQLLRILRLHPNFPSCFPLLKAIYFDDKNLLPGPVDLIPLDFISESSLPALQTIESCRIDLIIRFLAYPGARLLRSISLIPSTNPSLALPINSTQVRAFFDAVGKTCPQLETLRFRSIQICATAANLSGALTPLFGCTKLAHLEIETNVDFSITLCARDIKEMGVSWRRIRTLMIMTKGSRLGQLPPSISLDHLSKILKKCTALEVIALSVDTTKLSPRFIEVPPTLLPITPSLTAIHFSFSTISDPLCVAGWIAWHIPRQCKIYNYPSHSKPRWSQMWRDAVAFGRYVQDRIIKNGGESLMDCVKCEDKIANAERAAQYWRLEYEKLAAEHPAAITRSDGSRFLAIELPDCERC